MTERQLGRQYIHVDTGARFEVSEVSGDGFTLTLQSAIDDAAAYRLGLIEEHDGTKVTKDTTVALLDELTSAAWKEIS